MFNNNQKHYVKACKSSLTRNLPPVKRGWVLWKGEHVLLASYLHPQPVKSKHLTTNGKRTPNICRETFDTETSYSSTVL